MLELLDYRRRVSKLYAEIRQREGDQEAYYTFRTVRDDLFAHHSQSALNDEQKAAFIGLQYYDYDPAFRVLAALDRNVEQETFEVDLGDDGIFHYRRIGQVMITLPTGSGRLSVFWIEGYGGGIFLPFGDATNRETTYGAGRYLYDTIKGADLGSRDGKMVLDFNFAYNPSCSYHHRWVCPLAPPENKLTFPIMAGEQHIDR